MPILLPHYRECIDKIAAVHGEEIVATARKLYTKRDVLALDEELKSIGFYV